MKLPGKDGRSRRVEHSSRPEEHPPRRSRVVPSAVSGATKKLTSLDLEAAAEALERRERPKPRRRDATQRLWILDAKEAARALPPERAEPMKPETPATPPSPKRAPSSRAVRSKRVDIGQPPTRRGHATPATPATPEPGSDDASLFIPPPAMPLGTTYTEAEWMFAPPPPPAPSLSSLSAAEADAAADRPLRRLVRRLSGFFGRAR
jgi:hypothetical protein